jgi:hypothetical protein
MKLSKRMLKQIIREEILNETNGDSPFARAVDRPLASESEPEEDAAPGQTKSTPSGLEGIDPKGSLRDNMFKILQIISAYQVDFAGTEKAVFLNHLTALIESFIESDISAESSLRMRLNQTAAEMEKINRRK